jgi:glyoxylase-like metal-dependent hydrolase (beta-lactamase superfamily II)
MRACIGLGCVLLAFVGVAASQDVDFNKVEIKTTKVSGNIYMLEGEGGNIGVSVGEDGIVIVDDEFAPLAEKIRAALKGISDKPVKFVINTHHHGDHTGANANFAQQGSTIIAQDNVRNRLNGNTVGPGGKMKPAVAKDALPIVTFNDKATLWLNGEEIRAIHFPAGHTDGDSVVWFVKSNVVHMGDDFVTYGYPFVDFHNGGSVSGMIAGCEKVLATVPADTKFIPGHGPLSKADDIRTFVQMLKDTRAIVAAEVKKGRTLEQIQKANLLTKWDEKYGKDYIKPDAWVETLYDDVTHPKEGVGYMPHGHTGEKK